MIQPQTTHLVNWTCGGGKLEVGRPTSIWKFAFQCFHTSKLPCLVITYNWEMKRREICLERITAHFTTSNMKSKQPNGPKCKYLKSRPQIKTIIQFTAWQRMLKFLVNRFTRAVNKFTRPYPMNQSKRFTLSVTWRRYVAVNLHGIRVIHELTPFQPLQHL